MKKIFLENLPRKGVSNVIDWFKTKGCKIKFIYENIEGELEIVDIKRENKRTMLGLKYLENDIIYMFTGHFTKCKLGEIVGENTTKHHYKVGNIIEVSTGKIKIKELIRGKDNKKEYIYECLECNWQNGKISEGNLKKKQGCGCCTNRVPVLGINTVYDTDPWMIPYFINFEDSKRKTFGSNDIGLLHCPICKTKKPTTMIASLYRDKIIHCETCSDGFSYPEKFIYHILKKLNIQLERHKRDFEWLKPYNKEYDICFYINKTTYVLEMHGLQHYQDCFGKFKDGNRKCKTLKEEQENDIFKKQLALSNGIEDENYIVIDSRYSTLEWLKQNIIKSRLNELFDLDNIDWNKCDAEANSSYLIKACEHHKKGLNYVQIAKEMNIYWKTVSRYIKRASEFGLSSYTDVKVVNNENYNNIIDLWNSNIHNTTEISEQLGVSRDSVCEYLRKAEKQGLVEYKKYISNSDKKKIKNTEYNKEFISINQASLKSEETFGIKLFRKGITESCNTGRAYKGLHFQYIDNNNINIQS